jgi:starch synthase (maltosyl-transferring)
MGEPPIMGREFASAAIEPVASADPTGPRFRIEDVYPCVDNGRYAVKRIAGDEIEIWADIIGDGHEIIAAAIRWQREGASHWHSEPMQMYGNDRWNAKFTPRETGRYLYQIEAWSDRFASWRKGFLLKQDAGQDVTVDAREGAQLIADLMPRSHAASSIAQTALKTFKTKGRPDALVSPELAQAMAQSHVRPDLSRSAPIPLMVERPRARAAAWYEMVPRSQSKVPGQHGTFDDCIARVPDIAALGCTPSTCHSSSGSRLATS